jgi:diaminohydroxyphosphoribosylaminopyrimidine deaminase/5-amino-6-(5-phosphoribosylamino)uracil reductase
MMQQFGHYSPGAINHLLVEAGAKLNASLLAAGLVDELLLYLAPSLFGDSARGLFALPELERLEDRVNLDITEVRSVGRDLRISARIRSV